MAQEVVIWIFVLSLFHFAALHLHQLNQFLLAWEDFSCPGTWIIVDLELSEEQRSVISGLIQTYPGPIILFETDNASSMMTEGQPHQREIICYNLIVFHHNVTTALTTVYNQMSAQFVLKNTVVFTPNCSLSEARRLLDDVQQERIIVVGFDKDFLPNKEIDIFQWRIDGQVHHIKTLEAKVSLAIARHEKRNDMMGRKLRMATLHFPPAVFLKTDEKNDIVSISGVESSLINLLAEQLNFTIEYLPPNQEEMWGLPVGNNEENVTLAGLRGKLMRREADVAFAELHIIDFLIKYYSFSTPFKTNYDCFIVPSPIPYPKWMSLIFPFSPSTWIVLCIAVLLVVLTLHFMSRWSFSGEDSFFHDVCFCFLYVIGNFLAVQQPRRVRSTFHRLFMISWLFLVTTTSTVYRSGFISFLTQPITPPPIRTIQQLTQSPIKKIAFSTYIPGILINSSDPYRRQLGYQVISTENITDLFSMLDSGQWAVDSTIDNLLYEAARRYPTLTNRNSVDIPKFHLMEECLFPILTTFGLQKNSALKPYFDRGILRLIETGMVKYHRSKFVKDMKDFRDDTSAASKHLVSFSLQNLQGAFYLFVCGILASIFTLIFELVFFHLAPKFFFNRIKFNNVQ